MSEELGKWPRLLIVGEDVTTDQAAEINIRTHDQWWSTNDREKKNQYKMAAGMLADTDTVDSKDTYKSEDAYHKRYHCLDLSFLSTSAIMSSWIGGPHSWCSWSGYIFSNTTNIGKWPEIGNVERDWQLIAAAFPYLDLRCQLLADEGEGAVVVEYRVQKGEVQINMEPGSRLVPPVEISHSALLACVAMSPAAREFGITSDQLVARLKTTERRLRERGEWCDARTT